MIESMKIRQGLVFTLSIEPNQVIVIGNNNKLYVYNIEEGKYALINVYPLRLKVIKVDKSIVECNIIADEYNIPYKRISLFSLKRLPKWYGYHRGKGRNG